MSSVVIDPSSCVLLTSGVAAALLRVADRALVMGLEVVAVFESVVDSVRRKPWVTARKPALRPVVGESNVSILCERVVDSSAVSRGVEVLGLAGDEGYEVDRDKEGRLLWSLESR